MQLAKEFTKMLTQKELDEIKAPLFKDTQNKAKWQSLEGVGRTTTTSRLQETGAFMSRVVIGAADSIVQLGPARPRRAATSSSTCGHA
jgi:hypothetical protein